MLYMVTWIPSIYPSHVSIYTSTRMLWDIQWINMLIHEPMVISGLTSEYHYQLITGSYDGKSMLANPLMMFNWLLPGHIIRNGQ